MEGKNLRTSRPVTAFLAKSDLDQVDAENLLYQQREINLDVLREYKKPQICIFSEVEV